MPLVFAGITPHTPVLFPTVGKEKLQNLEKTQKALELLEAELYTTKPNKIIVISPHGTVFPDTFSINSYTHFESSLEEFGDVVTKQTWKGSPELAAGISEAAYKESVPVRLISEEKIDHGACVPLFYLTKHLPNIGVLPIGYSNLSPKDHLNFGKLLKEVIAVTRYRIAVIASADLSHALKIDSPAGFNEKGKEFDNTLIELLETRNTVGIANLDPEMVREASECGYRSILILLGLLKDMDYQFHNLAYESPFGVGHLTGNFHF